MSKPLTIVADADAIIAQVSQTDAHHQITQRTVEMLLQKEAQILYPVTAVLEANAFIQRVLNEPEAAYEIAKIFQDPQVSVVEINQETLAVALQYFSANQSKKHTLFDCVVAAVAEEYQADAIFSFDKFYKTKGFTLASEFLNLK